MTSKALARVILGVHGLSLIALVSGAQSVPPRLADTTYWRMITEMSEPDGFFRSDNLVGNGVIGDFAGPKALRAVGRWVRAHDAKIDALYVSNVEQYLFMSPDA